MRRLIAVLLAVLAVLQFELWVAEDGLREVWRLEDQLRAQTRENERLANRNSELEAEVDDLKQGLSAVEERARSELGMVRSDETFFQVVPARAGRSEAERDDPERDAD